MARFGRLIRLLFTPLGALRNRWPRMTFVMSIVFVLVLLPVWPIRPLCTEGTWVSKPWGDVPPQGFLNSSYYRSRELDGPRSDLFADITQNVLSERRVPHIRIGNTILLQGLQYIGNDLRTAHTINWAVVWRLVELAQTPGHPLARRIPEGLRSKLYRLGYPTDAIDDFNLMRALTTADEPG